MMLPGDEIALDGRGLAAFRAGHYADAINDCTAALGVELKRASSHFVRGVAELKLGWHAQGNADIYVAKALDPKIAATYARYGVTP